MPLQALALLGRFLLKLVFLAVTTAAPWVSRKDEANQKLSGQMLDS